MRVFPDYDKEIAEKECKWLWWKPIVSGHSFVIVVPGNYYYCVRCHYKEGRKSTSWL